MLKQQNWLRAVSNFAVGDQVFTSSIWIELWRVNRTKATWKWRGKPFEAADSIWAKIWKYIYAWNTPWKMSVLHNCRMESMRKSGKRKEDQPIFLQQHQWGYCHWNNHPVKPSLSRVSQKHTRSYSHLFKPLSKLYF